MIKRFSSLLLALLLLFVSACTVSSPSPLRDLPEVAASERPGETDNSPSSASSLLPTEPAAQEGLDENGVYTSKEDLAHFLHAYGRLPRNFITKGEARALGWEGGPLEAYAPGMCIGGDRFGNYEGLLPDGANRTYYECDVDTLGSRSRGAKRIVYSDDGLIYYTDDHYASFSLLFGDGEGEMEG